MYRDAISVCVATMAKLELQTLDYDYANPEAFVSINQNSHDCAYDLYRSSNGEFLGRQRYQNWVQSVPICTSNGYEVYPLNVTTRLALRYPDVISCYCTSKEKCPKDYCAETGNPIASALSLKVARQQDFAGPFSALSTRTYISNGAANSRRSSFGSSWVQAVSSSIASQSVVFPAQFLARRGDGTFKSFDQSGDFWIAESDTADRLLELKDINNIRTGWKYYEAATENTEQYGATGRLQSITTRTGVVQTLAYNGAGQLTTVTDSYGRTLSFTYFPANAATGANNIATVSDPLGNIVSYTYDAANNLATVTYPNGGIKTYLYNEPAYTANTNLPNALTGITDENGTRFATYAYDTQGRAISTEHAGGVEKYQLNYVSPYAQTIVTDPLGTARTYNFQTILGVVKTTGVDQPCPTCGGTQSQATTYDANGNVASRTDFNNKKSCSAYDLTRNLETGRIEGLLSGEDCAASLATPPNRADVRKTSTTWHATYRLPLTITEPAAAATIGGAAGVKSTVFTYDSSGNLLTRNVTAPKNDGTSATELRTWTWTYNTLGQVLTAKDPLNKTTTTVYYPATDTATPQKYTKGDVQTVTNAAGHITTFNEYDKNGRLTNMTDPNGLITTMTYHPRGWITSRAVNNGVTTETTQFTYDNVGQLTRIVMPDGSALYYAYDNAHRLAGMSDQIAGVTVQPNGSLRPATTDFTGNKVIYALDNMGNRIHEQHFAPGPYRVGVQEAMNPTNVLTKLHQRVIDSLNRVQKDLGGTNYAPDPPPPNQSIQKVAPPENPPPPPEYATTQYGYDNNGNLTTTTDPLGRVTTHVFDALNRLINMIDPYNGATKPTVYVYDQAGNLTTVADPQGLTTIYTYNGHNNLITQASPDTGATVITYDSAGNVTAKLDATGRCAVTTYDALNRAVTVKYIASASAATCAPGTAATAAETISYTYDSTTATVGGAGGTGRLGQIADGTGNTVYVYDRNGRVLSKTQTTTGITNPAQKLSYVYNNAGQLQNTITPSGQTFTYTYGAPGSNAPGKLVGIDVNGISVLTGSVYAPFGPNGGWSWGNYNDTSLINQHLRVFDLDYRPTAISSDPEGYNRNIAWAQANRITAITVPGTNGGAPTITLPGISNALSVNQAYGYDALDRLTSFAAGYPGATTPATGQGVLPAEAFTYDAIGNRLSRTATPPGGSPSTATYAYPNTSATPAPNRNHTLASIAGAQVNAYTYDATGNTKTESAALGTSINPTPSTPLTQTYDAKNRLKITQIGATATDTVTYKINALGQRVQKTGAGAYAYSTALILAPSTGMSSQGTSLAYNARYVYDEQGRLLGEYSPEGELIAETIWFEDLPVATIRSKGANNQIPLGIAGTGAATANNAGNNTPGNPVNVDVYYLHPDHLGTPRAMTRSVAANNATTGPDAINKAVWRWESDPFGTSLNASAPNGNPQNVTGTASQITAASFSINNRFPGQLADAESGKYYNYFRDYDAGIGRYTTSDRVGLKAGLSTYGYVWQQPTRKIDPFGLYGCRWIGLILECDFRPPPIPGLPGYPDAPPQQPISPPNLGPITWCVVFPAICAFDWAVKESRRRGKSDPVYLPPVNPGRDCNGNCNPCPPGASWYAPGGGHGHDNGVWHRIDYNQDPATCMCYPDRPSQGLGGN